MKKVLCAALLLFSFVFAFGQKDKSAEAKEAKSITFYGVDFSLSKAFGVGESPAMLKNAFDNINLLFTTEAKKYNIYSFFSKDEVVSSFDMVNKLNRGIDESALYGTNKQFSLTSDEIAKHVKAYKTEGNGVALIFIGERLDKLDGLGTFHVVFFDKKTKAILLDRVSSAKAFGFGLRNYWASSIYKIMKEWRY
ncbi:hypothetical protein [uncultured Acetobacteroides sp.]|uniref:hypothetical protein n=1 Tax=uncultured Acetobacteroides sp. TaxID=1760811 RepID=UPI0029F4BAB5|nr:hypothetical protein [uncultured Acetobacteroides sp.]